MKNFMTIADVESEIITNDHEGIGKIEFRRLFVSENFSSPIDFIDLTIVPPSTVIGNHFHYDNEEAYLIIKGSPTVKIGKVVKRLEPGSIAVVHSGESHSLSNDTQEIIWIFVIQVKIV